MNSQVTAQTSSKGKYCQKTIEKGRGSQIGLHIRRIVLEIVNLLFNHDWVFFGIGKINKKWGIVKSVFLVYPATEEYALAYVYRYRIKRVVWSPWLAGVLWQNGKLSIMFVISAHNGSFVDPDNYFQLCAVAQRMEKLRKLFCAENKTFAGTLPGILYLKRVIRDAPEADLTAVAVVQAINKIKSAELLDDSAPIVILGGRGFIGRRVVRLLASENVYPVDIVDGKGRDDWPTHLADQRMMVVNITLNNAIAEYMDLFGSGTIVVNEVYPEPSLEVRKRLKEMGCSCYHVTGIRAFAIPAFPAAYKGAIPCCAAWLSEKMEVSVSKIV